MSHQFSFEKLEVWYLAKEFSKRIYAVTKKFPIEERFGLTAQLTRAAVSVASTIAEGSARASKKDQAHFSQLAYGSLMEIACQLIISCELGYLNNTEYQELRDKMEKISNKLNALRNYQLRAFSSQAKRTP